MIINGPKAPNVAFVYRWSSTSRRIAAWNFAPDGRWAVTKGALVPGVNADTIRDRLIENLIRTGSLKG